MFAAVNLQVTAQRSAPAALAHNQPPYRSQSANAATCVIENRFEPGLNTVRLSYEGNLPAQSKRIDKLAPNRLMSRKFCTQKHLKIFILLLLLLSPPPCRSEYRFINAAARQPRQPWRSPGAP
jgi:hypothetical protein